MKFDELAESFTSSLRWAALFIAAHMSKNFLHYLLKRIFSSMITMEITTGEIQRMEKAYDIKELVKMAQADGIEVLEEEAKSLIKVTCEWLHKSAEISETPYDDMAFVILPKIQELALGAAEKINPADNAAPSA